MTAKKGYAKINSEIEARYFTDGLPNPKEDVLHEAQGGEHYLCVCVGSEENRALVTSLGLEAMMIPRLCIKMQPFHIKLMHKEDGYNDLVAGFDIFMPGPRPLRKNE